MEQCQRRDGERRCTKIAGHGGSHRFRFPGRCETYSGGNTLAQCLLPPDHEGGHQFTSNPARHAASDPLEVLAGRWWPVEPTDIRALCRQWDDAYNAGLPEARARVGA